MKYSTEKLIEEMDNGIRHKWVHFWGHQPSADGSISKTCFSQWWNQHPFEVESIEYKTAEHWMMAEKARLFEDAEALEAILACETAAEAKKWGRKVRNFDHYSWEKQRFEIVKQGNLHKFSQHKDLLDFLLKTGQRVLVEASPVDVIWGIGLKADHPHATYPLNWKGLNLLGFALMEVRDELTTN